MGRKERKRWAGNDRVRDLLKQSESRELSPEEIDEIRTLYTGYGGLSSWNTDQFFTPPVVTRFVVDLLGIQEGEVLEASCGGGAFIQPLPSQCSVTGIELMHETAMVAKLTCPGAEIIAGNALEMVPELEGRFDWAIGNPPFGKLAKRDAPEGFRVAEGSAKIEWYFVELCFRALKPGGMLALVVPDGILSNSKDQKYRRWFLDNAWYRATVSLPTETFVHVGTSVKTSVIVIQKPTRGHELPKEDYLVFMAMCENIGWDRRRRETGKCDLPEVLRHCREEFGGLDARHLAKPYIKPVESPPKPQTSEQLQLESPAPEPFEFGDQLSLF